jgi:hypothetical protein
MYYCHFSSRWDYMQVIYDCMKCLHLRKFSFIHCSKKFDHFSMCSFSCFYCILYHRVLTDMEFTGELGHSGCAGLVQGLTEMDSRYLVEKLL